MFDFTHAYYQFTDDVQNRLDALYNDTVFIEINSFISRSKFGFVSINDLVEYCRESRDPRTEPDEEFDYVDIGSINTNEGTTEPTRMLGRDAISSRVRRKISAGNVLISTTRPTRRAITIVPSALDGQICSTGFAVVNPKEGVDGQFLFYALRTRISTLQFERLCSGSGYPAINQETDLPKLLLPFPDFVTQQQIVAHLQPLEAQAAQLERQAVELQEEANTYMLEALGLAVPENRNYFFKSGQEGASLSFINWPDQLADRLHYLYYHPRYAALDELCGRYKTVPLAEICTRPISRGEQPDYDETGEVLVLKTVDLKNRYIAYHSALRVSQEFYDDKPNAQVQKGDVILAATGFVSMGKVDVFNSDEQAIISGELLALRVKEKYSPEFVAYFLRSPLGQLQIEKYWTGSSGQIHMYPDDVADFILPSYESLPLDRQEVIAAEISQRIQKAIDCEEQARQKRDSASAMFERFILDGYSEVSNPE